MVDFLIGPQGCSGELLIAPAIGIVQASFKVKLGALSFAGESPAQGVLGCDGNVLSEPLQAGHGLRFSSARGKVQRLKGCASLDLLSVPGAPFPSSWRLVRALQVPAVADVMLRTKCRKLLAYECCCVSSTAVSGFVDVDTLRLASVLAVTLVEGPMRRAALVAVY